MLRSSRWSLGVSEHFFRTFCPLLFLLFANFGFAIEAMDPAKLRKLKKANAKDRAPMPKGEHPKRVHIGASGSGDYGVILVIPVLVVFLEMVNADRLASTVGGL